MDLLRTYRVVISHAGVSIDNVELMASSLEFSNNFMLFSMIENGQNHLAMDLEEM